jgi:preprotein translocase subunit SecF
MATERIKDYLNHLNIDFVRYRYYFAAFSAVLVLAAWALFFVRGPNWGIDFTGGTEIQMRFEEPVDIVDVRAALGRLGLSEDSVQQIGAAEEYEFKVRIQDPTFGAEEARREVEAVLVEKYGPDWIQEASFDAQVGARFVISYAGDEVRSTDVATLFEDMDGVVVQAGQEDNQIVIQLPGLSNQIQATIQQEMGAHAFEVRAVDAVGPKVGADLREQGAIAILATMLLVLIYIGFRFDLSFAPGAIVALVHDVSVVIGVLVLFQREFSVSIIGALLTIIGYSLNDTVVIYDRLRENREKFRKKGMKDLVNISLNETLSRTVTTSGATMLAVIPFLVFGGPVVGDFAFAMFIGLITGAYSTIYIASPMILVMEELKPSLSRLIVNANAKPAETAPSGAEEGDGSPDAPPSPPLTESEKRRRERAEREQSERDRTKMPHSGR